MQRLARKILRAVADYDPEYYDMYADQNETLFAQLYVKRITQHAEAAGIRPPATVLEAGCQAGRLVVPLAQLGFQVTGVDTSGFGLRRARAHAKAVGVEATFEQGDMIDVLKRTPDRRYDIVVCAEVVYLSPKYREMLKLLAQAVRPGGLLCVSHRPRAYYLLEALRQQDLETAASVLGRGEGPFRDSAYYNWQTEEELKTLYRSLGVQWIAHYPIDQWAWLSGLNPSQLTATQQEQWLAMELEGTREIGMGARYVLVVAAVPVIPRPAADPQGPALCAELPSAVAAGGEMIAGGVGGSRITFLRFISCMNRLKGAG